MHFPLIHLRNNVLYTEDRKIHKIINLKWVLNHGTTNGSRPFGMVPGYFK